MPDDASGHDPRDHEFARWLHALAEMVDRNPDLAELVRRRADPPLEHTLDGNVAGEDGTRNNAESTRNDTERGALPNRGECTQEQVEETPDSSEHAPDLPAPSADGEGSGVGPLLRHMRRSSRYGPPSVSGRPPELGTGIPDPFMIFARDGADGLRRALETLRIGSLRAIIRAHSLDPQGKLPASATEKRLIAAIVTAAQQGKAT